MDPGDEINAWAFLARGAAENPTTGGRRGWDHTGQWETPLYFYKHMVLVVKSTPVTIYL